MEYRRAYEIVKTEKECVLRASGGGCSRDCASCDLLLDTDEIIEAYDQAIQLLDIYALKIEQDRKKAREREESARAFHEVLIKLGFDPDKEIPSMLEFFRALEEMMEEK